jgi:hypothetical protein
MSFESAISAARSPLVASIIESAPDVKAVVTAPMVEGLISIHLDMYETKTINELIEASVGNKTIYSCKDLPENISNYNLLALLDICAHLSSEDAFNFKLEDIAMTYIIAAYNIYIEDKTPLIKAAR